MTEPITFERELDFFESWDKLIERLTVAKVAMENHIPISEEDMEVLRVIHKYFFNGDLIFYKTSMSKSDEKAEQGLLFTDNSVKPENLNPNGTGFEFTEMN